MGCTGSRAIQPQPQPTITRTYGRQEPPATLPRQPTQPQGYLNKSSYYAGHTKSTATQRSPSPPSLPPEPHTFYSTACYRYHHHLYNYRESHRLHPITDRHRLHHLLIITAIDLHRLHPIIVIKTPPPTQRQTPPPTHHQIPPLTRHQVAEMNNQKPYR